MSITSSSFDLAGCTRCGQVDTSKPTQYDLLLYGKLAGQWEALGSYITEIANVKINTTEQEKSEIRFELEDDALLAIKSLDADVAEHFLRFDGSTTIGVPQRKYHQLLKDLVAAKSRDQQY